KYHQYRRTLQQHHEEGRCPDLNIKFRFYDDVAAEDHKDVRGQDNIDLESPDKLIEAYVAEYRKNKKRHTLMCIPANVGEISAAKVALKLEQELLKIDKKLKIINFGGCEDSSGNVDLTSI